MKTLLLPVDFTDTSRNAVNFAIEWARKFNYERIIMLKTFYDSMFENITVSAEYSYFNEDYLNTERDKNEALLNNWCRTVADAAPGLKVMTAQSELPLLRAIMEVVQTEQPELVIVGSDHYEYASESIIAASVIAIAKISPVQVLIVPSAYTYQPVKDVLVPCDIKALENVERIKGLENKTRLTGIRLHVVNVNTKDKPVNPEHVTKLQALLAEYLQGFDYTLNFRNNRNVISGINEFCSEQPVQLIIALPGKHSFLYTLTHSSISEAIYSNAGQPVLILK